MEPLVTTDWLANEMAASDLRIVDASRHLADTGRDAAAEYVAGHIPGAVFMDLAGRYAGRVKICEMGTQAAPRTSGELGVRATPTVLFVRDGAVVETIVGVRSSLYFAEAIEELFGVPPKPVKA